MQTLFNRIAWFRMQQYILRHTSHRIVVAGSYGRTLVANMIYSALREHRHVRLGYPVQDIADIPLGILGTDHETKHGNIITFLTGAWQHELHEKEPDTIITEVLLLQPGFIPYANSRILPHTFVLHHVANAEEEYREALQYLGRDVTLIINADDEHALRIGQESELQTITYGRSMSADIRIVRTVRGDSSQGIFITIEARGAHHGLFLPHLFAKEHVSTFACAIACAYARKISITDAMRGIQHMELPEGALRKQIGKTGEEIVSERVECIVQITESLKSFASLPHTGRKIIVLSDVENSLLATNLEYNQLGQYAAQASSFILFVGDTMRAVQQVVNKQYPNVDTHHFATKKEALSWLRGHVTQSDMVYISGVELDI